MEQRKMIKSHLVLYVVVLILSIVLLGMNIYDCFRGYEADWLDLVLYPLFAVIASIRIVQMRRAERNADNENN